MRALALLTFLLFCVYMVFARWYFVCEVRQMCGDEPAIVEDLRLKTLQLREGEQVILRDYDQFAFDSAAIAPRLNDNNRAFLDTLAAILSADSSKHLGITAFYRDNEKAAKSGFYENPGLARADAIRRLLVARGISEERIKPDYGLSEDPLLREPLLFDMYTPDARPDDYDKVAFTFTNMTFSDANFAFGSDEFRPGGAFVLYADSVRLFLANNPDKGLTIIGHTDNVGDDKFNDKLGLRRAKSAQAYFEEAGVGSDIKVASMGKRQPTASNNTPEGRQRNRRVNFVLE